jgi:hypothetical protein
MDLVLRQWSWLWNGYSPLQKVPIRKALKLPYAAVGLVSVWFSCGVGQTGTCTFLSELENRFCDLPMAQRQNVMVTAAHVLKPQEDELREMLKLPGDAPFDFDSAVTVTDILVTMADGTEYSVDCREGYGWVAHTCYGTRERNIALGSDVAVLRCHSHAEKGPGVGELLSTRVGLQCAWDKAGGTEAWKHVGFTGWKRLGYAVRLRKSSGKNIPVSPPGTICMSGAVPVLTKGMSGGPFISRDTGLVVGVYMIADYSTGAKYSAVLHHDMIHSLLSRFQTDTVHRSAASGC